MKKELIFFGLMFLVFTLYSTSALAALCGNNTILTLYSQDNSHAAYYNSTFSAPGAIGAICYDTYFTGSVNSNPWKCNGANTVLKLSSLSNAHVGNSTSNYNTNICFEDISCQIRQNSCLTGEQAIASTSGYTNAHISSNNNTYSYKLCCSKIVTPVALWADPLTGIAIIESAINLDVNMTVAALGASEGQAVTIVVYNKSNNVLLASFSTNAYGEKATIKKNIQGEIITNKAGVGSTIYFVATYGTKSATSGDLLIKPAERNLIRAEWRWENGGLAASVNQTKELRLYAETSGIPNGQNITFSIYDEDGFMRNETNYTVNSNIAASNFHRIRLFINGTLGIDEQFYFNISDPVSGKEISSNRIVYRPDIDVTTYVISCFDVSIDDKCSDFSPLTSYITNMCDNFKNISTCVDNPSGSSKCAQQDEIFNIGTNTYDPVCSAQTVGEFSACENGWKTLTVRVEKLNACSGSCDSGGDYRIPCRNVAALPIFTVTNLIIAAGLVIIIYLVTYSINSRKRKK